LNSRAIAVKALIRLGGCYEKLGKERASQEKAIASFRVPDGRSLAFQASGKNLRQGEVWVMENFLPADKVKK
jgi:hypothetical protein